VTVTPVGYGDPDLYISRSVPHMTSETTEWWAVSYGEDALTLTPADYAGFSTIYVGVYGYTTVSYSIVAAFDESIALIAGLPHSASIQREQTQYYTFAVTTPSQIDHIAISAVCSSGRVQVVVSVTEVPDPLISSTWQWLSSQEYSGEALVIWNTDPNWSAGPNSIYYIGIFSDSDASYHITVSTSDTHVMLQDGIAAHGTVDAGDAKYFRYDIHEEGCSLNLQLTAITGDPDLYVSTSEVYPDLNAEYHAINYGDDFLSFAAPAAIGAYYMAVIGFETSSFTLMSTLNCPSSRVTYIQLSTGTPQTGTLGGGQFAYYRITLDSGSVDLSLVLTRTYGDPDLYITTNIDSEDVSMTNYMWRSIAYGDDSWTIAASDDNFCADCTYYILVDAFQACQFTLTASTSDGSTTLQQETPLQASVETGAYAYFRTFVTSNVEELTITISPLGRGDPDLYVSATNSRPTRESYTWQGNRVMGDSVSIPNTDTNFCTNCWIYIGVYGYTATTFSVVAHYGGSTSLQDGVPQSGHVERSEMVYYTFAAWRGHDEFTVTLTPLAGDSTFYMSSNMKDPEINDPSTYQFQPDWWTSIKTVTVQSTDANACTDTSCHYIIGVYGNTNASYTILADTGEATVTLVNGVAHTDDVQQGEYQYYSFEVAQANMDVSFTITAINGDPDLYVALSTTTTRPTSSNFDFDSLAWGSDSVHIDNAPIGTYYIGVYGFQTSQFTITALSQTEDGTDPDNAISLTLGHPQSHDLEQGRYVYYSFILGATTPELTFTLTPTSGDPDIYARNDGQTPSRTFYQWDSMGVSTDTIRIQNASPGTFLIAVYGYSQTSFSLTVTTTGSLTTLQNGTPLTNSMTQGQWHYYMLPVNAEEDVTVSVTSFSGDPDIYVSTTQVNPTFDDYMWDSNAYLADSVTIPHTDPNWCQCNFYIGVYAWSATSYQITATFSMPITLQSGVASSGEVGVHAMVVYALNVPAGAQDVTISVSPLTGNARLFVATGREPETSDYDWMSTQWNGGSIVIRSSDSDWPCTGNSRCILLIGVYGVTASSYSLTATTSSESVMLRNGVAVTEHVDTDSWEQFTFTVDQDDVTLRVAITPSSGDPDIYISRNGEPSYSNWEWESNAYGADAIEIVNAARGVYYIGVYGWESSTYSIMAIMETGDECGSSRLVLGQPQNAALTQGDYHCYVVTLTESYADLSISVTRITGDPDVYVWSPAVDGDMTDYNYDYASVNYGTDVLTIYNPDLGDYRIRIYGYTDTQYTITVTTESSSHMLTPGVPVSATLRAGEYDYFEVLVDSLAQDLTVTVTSFIGDPDLYMSHVEQRPTLANFVASQGDRQARSTSSDSITIPKSELVIGTYYIGVQGWTNSSFSIVAHFDSPVFLSDGVATEGTVAHEAARFYTFALLEHQNDCTVTLSPTSGHAYLYVSAGRQPVLDDMASIDWSSNHPEGVQQIVIDALDPKFCRDCVYYVMVFGMSDAQYVLSMTTSAVTIRLQAGIPFMSWASDGTYKFFQFTNPLANGAVTITVTPFSGDPDIYMSTSTPSPTMDDYDWAAMAYGADSLTVDYTEDNFVIGEFYIGVYGWMNTSFTITARLVDLSGVDPTNGLSTALFDGVPQTGLLTNPNDMHYYTFTLGATGNLSVTVTPLYGDPDVYIVDDGTTPGPQQTGGWVSMNWGRDSITVPRCGDGRTATCSYTIGVNAYTHTLYTILAGTSSAASLLQSGRPVQGFVDGDAWQYYRFECTRSDVPLVLSLSALSGDPDLFVSMTNPRPSYYDFDWTHENVGSDVLTLTGDDVRIGWYFIGVYGWTSSSFYLTATLGDIVLIPGRPYEDALSSGQIRYYYFTTAADDLQDIVVSLQFMYGNAAMYITTNDASPPGPHNYQWDSTQVNNVDLRNTLTIHSTDTYFCSACTYYVAVHGASESSFTVTMTNGNHNVLLATGRAYNAYLDAGAVAYFYAFVNDNSFDVSIDVTAYTGDLRMYMSTTTSQPSEFDNCGDTCVDESGGSLHISFPRDDKDFVIGEYYIAVYASTAARFTIVLSTASTQMVDGTPIHNSLPSSGVNYYFFYHAGNDDLRLDISQITSSGNSRGPFQVYVTTSSHAVHNTTTPSADDYLWYKQLSFGQHMVFVLGEPDFCSQCTYYIAIYGEAGDEYELRLTGQGQYAVLIPEQYVYGTVQEQSYMYYETFVDVALNFTVRLETCTGNADIFMSQDTYQPTRRVYTWRSEQNDANDMVTINDANLVHVGFYLGVYGMGAGQNSYRMTVHTHEDATFNANFPKPGNNGALKIELTNQGVLVTFANARSPIGKTLQYKAFFSDKDSNIVMYSQCGLEYAFSSKSVLGDPSGTTSILLTNKDHFLQEGQSYKINVAAIDSDDYYGIYQWGTIDVSEFRGGSGFMYTLIIIAVVVLMLAVVILIIRNRRLSKELEVEMGDIPKAVVRKAVRGPPAVAGNQQKGTVNYNQLLESPEDEGEYEPPPI